MRGLVVPGGAAGAGPSPRGDRGVLWAQDTPMGRAAAPPWRCQGSRGFVHPLA